MRGRPRMLNLDRTFGTRTPPASASKLEDPGKRRRHLEEIGTWPTRP
jgi:hypothetical protein